MAEMNDDVKKYLQEKYQEQLNKINVGQAFSNLGDVFAQQKVGTANPFFSEQRKLAYGGTLGEYENEQDRLARAAQAKDLLDLKKMMYGQAGQQRKLEAEKLQKIPASIAQEIGGANASISALEEARKSFQANQDISGPWQGMASRGAAQFEIGELGKRAKAFDAQLKLNAQTIGKYLEGGKMTDSDIERYKSMLPNLNDSPDIAAIKSQQIENMIAQKQQSEKEGLLQAGYNVGQIETGEIGQNPNVPTKIHGGQKYIKVQGGWQKVGP